MIRKLIIPPPALIMMGLFTAFVLFVEWGVATDHKGAQVIVSDATCVGSGVNAGNLVSLALDCGPKYPAETTTPATIRQYVANSTTKFRCDLHQNGSADCLPITAKK